VPTFHVDAIQGLTQDDTEQNVPLKYAGGRESRYICLECYEASAQLPGMIQKLASATVYLTQGESFFTMDVMNNVSGEVEPFKNLRPYSQAWHCLF
jgi:hypothetical protein